MDNRLYERRKELGLTLEDVGKIVGVSKSTVKKWESGYIENMKRDKIALLAKALQVSPLYIMGIDCNLEEANNENYIRLQIESNTKPSLDSNDHYYLNDETRQIAQDVFENPELRTLFKVARDIPPERLKAHIEFMKNLKEQETKHDDEGC